MFHWKGGSEKTAWFIDFPSQLGCCIECHPLGNKSILCFLQEVLWDKEILTWRMCRRPPRLSELVIVPALFHRLLLCSFPVYSMGPQFISVQEKIKLKKKSPSGQEVKLVMQSLSQTLVWVLRTWFIICKHWPWCWPCLFWDVCQLLRGLYRISLGRALPFLMPCSAFP